jgi:hypothetical protein
MKITLLDVIFNTRGLCSLFVAQHNILLNTLRGYRRLGILTRERDTGKLVVLLSRYLLDIPPKHITLGIKRKHMSGNLIHVSVARVRSLDDSTPQYAEIPMLILLH